MSNPIENTNTEAAPYTPEGWAEAELDKIRQNLEALGVWEWQGVREEDAADYLV